MKRRILVLGSEHFVGAQLQRALLASDWAEPVPFLGPPRTLSARHLEGIEAVFNGTMGSPAAILAAARALYGALDLARRQLRVVHLSSMTVYGSRTGMADENAALRSDLGAYGAAQVHAESLAARYPATVILRPGCEYGPDCPQWSGRIARLLRSHRLGDLSDAGDGVCNLVFIDDLVGAILTSLRAPGIDGNCFNLAMRSPPTWNEYFSLFARALGAVPVTRIGRRRLQIEARLFAPPLKVLGSVLRRGADALPPAITPSLLSLCDQNITLDSRKAESVLGLGWMPLGDGVRQAASACMRDYSIGSMSMRRNSIG